MTRTLPLLFLLPACWSGFSQNYNPGYDLAPKEYLPFYSSVLKENRTIEIIVPSDFNEWQSADYDIIYVLDGIRALHVVAWDYLRGERFIPQNTILVGLLGQKDTHTRLRDFTPTSTYADSGGATNFLRFLKTELVPYINKTYHSSSDRSTLVGGSMGGLFVLYAFLNEPSLFKAYLALDPSLWWDHAYLDKQAAGSIGRLRGLDRLLWITGREGAAFDEMGIPAFEALLKSSAPVDLTWKCVPYPNETHLTTWFKGIWDGLKFSYGGYYEGGIGFKPMGGVILKDKPFKLWCYQLSASTYIRCSTNGQEPTITSPNISSENTFAFSKDSKLVVKSFSAREEYNHIASADFKVGEILPSIERPPGVKPGGLKYAYFEGDWKTPPDCASMKPTRSGLAGPDFDLSGFPMQTTFACLLDGYLEIQKDGYYIFELGDEGGSSVYLGNLKLIGDHYDAHGGSTYMVPLQKGFYVFRVEYFHKKGGGRLEPVYIRPESSDEYPIPLQQLYSRN